MLLAAGDADDRQFGTGAVFISRLAETAGGESGWCVVTSQNEVLLIRMDKLLALNSPFLHPLRCVGIRNFKSCGFCV